MSPVRTPLPRYGAALLAVLIAEAARLALTPVLGGPVVPLAHVAALIAAAWFGGLGPCLVAMGLAIVAQSVWPGGPGRAGWEAGAVAGLALFVIVGLALALLGGALHASRRSLAELRRSRAGDRLRADEPSRLLIEQASDAILVADAEGRALEVNEAGCRLLRADRAALVGRPLSALVPSEDQPRFEALRRDLLDGDRHVGEWTLRRGDDSRLAVEISTRILTDGRWQLIARDITARKRAEAALRASEAQFRQMADTMPQIVWTADADGTVSFFNGRWYEYTGCSVAESLERDGWRSVVHPADLKDLDTLRHRAIDSGSMFEAEFRLRDCGGGYRWHLVRSVPVRDPDGQVVRRYGTATDIDDRKRASEALAVSEERLRLALAAGRMGTWDWNIRTGAVAWSDNLEEIHGLPPGGFDGTFEGYQRLIHPEDRPAVLAAIARSVEERSGYEVEFRNIQPDGSVHWIAGRGRVFTDAAGRPVRMLGVGMDITAEKQAEQALREADRRKDEFLAVLAHELRNPLAPLRTALQLMRPTADAVPGIEAERAMAERQVIHLARLVDDLMDISRITKGKIELRREPLELGEVVRRSVESARPALEQRGHALRVELPPGPVPVVGDPTRLEQVFGNLLRNAAKYTEPGGHVRIVAGREGDSACVRVEDNGIGIAPETLPHIFDMFVQAGTNPSRAQGGLGIGLSLVHSLVALHGGSITARSEGPGRGSTFTVRLPMPQPDAAEGAVAPARVAPASDEAPPMRRRRILVVDDNVDAATSLAKLLTMLYDQEARTAHDGPAALAAADEFRPDVILLDIGMPGMDGYEVARRLRARPEFAGTSLVALTGWGQEQDRARSRAAGFDHHLVKPIAAETVEDLLARLEPATRAGSA
jgi:PAS domain S-box-containing protein